MFRRPNHEPPDARGLLPYVADLELEVDRLRRQGQFIEHEVVDTVRKIRELCGEAAEAPRPALEAVGWAINHLAEVLQDVREMPGYHPAHDQVVSIAVRPLAWRVFRRHQRIEAAPLIALRLELETDSVDWFPARLHHILDNLFGNAFRYRDPECGEAWVCLALREVSQGYELRISHNGLNLSAAGRGETAEVFYRAAPARAAGHGTGMAIVRMLVEQSGGTMTQHADVPDAAFVVVLPRYDLTDFLT